MPSKGGIETFVYEISKRLVRNGHEVLVVTSSRGLSPSSYRHRVEGIDVVRYPERVRVWEVPFVPQIPIRAFLEAKHRVDLVHISGATPLQTDLAHMLLKARNKRIVYTHHFDPETRTGRLSKTYAWLSIPIVNLADVIVASTASYAATSPTLKRVLHKVRVIPMGVNPSEYLVRGLVGRESIVLFVGKLIYYKNPLGLLRSFARIANEVPESKLVFIGDGEEKPILIREAKRLGVSDRVVLRGFVERKELLAWLAEARVLALPSINRREAFGIVLLEAAASGLPVIGSNIPGVREVVESLGGLLVPPRDEEKLAEALKKALDDDGWWKAASSRGIHVVREKFSWESIYHRYLSLYRELVG